MKFACFWVGAEQEKFTFPAAVKLFSTISDSVAGSSAATYVRDSSKFDPASSLHVTVPASSEVVSSPSQPADPGFAGADPDREDS